MDFEIILEDVKMLKLKIEKSADAIYNSNIQTNFIVRFHNCFNVTHDMTPNIEGLI